MDSVLREALLWNVGLALGSGSRILKKCTTHFNSEYFRVLQVYSSVIIHTHNRVPVSGILCTDMSMLWR